MGGLPSTKRFYAEDYKESPQWFQRFLSQVNLFTEPIYNILNQGVDVNLNTDEEIYILQIPSASNTATNNVFSFVPKKFIGAPHGILLGQCLYNATTGVATAVGNPVTFDWIWTGSQVKILAVYGLTNAASYTLSLRIY
jgi:hypothetical protein